MIVGMLDVPVKITDEQAILPEYAHPGDAGVDLCSTCDVTLQPFERALIPTGLQVAIPPGFAGFIMPRSGLAIKHGLSLVNSPGLIDSNYRGELKVIAINLDSRDSFTVHKHDRIAQLVIMRVENIDFSICSQLDNTERGTGGFGSSGVTGS